MQAIWMSRRRFHARPCAFEKKCDGVRVCTHSVSLAVTNKYMYGKPPRRLLIFPSPISSMGDSLPLISIVVCPSGVWAALKYVLHVYDKVSISGVTNMALEWLRYMHEYIYIYIYTHTHTHTKWRVLSSKGRQQGTRNKESCHSWIIQRSCHRYLKWPLLLSYTRTCMNFRSPCVILHSRDILCTFTHEHWQLGNKNTQSSAWRCNEEMYAFVRNGWWHTSLSCAVRAHMLELPCRVSWYALVCRCVYWWLGCMYVRVYIHARAQSEPFLHNKR